MLSGCLVDGILIGRIHQKIAIEILIGNSIEKDSKNCLVSSNGRLTMGLGIDDLIVVETNDAVLVSKK